jgi:hypothetical protein
VHISSVIQAPAYPQSEPAAERGTDYAKLSRQVREAGLLDRRLHYYRWKIAITAALFAAGWTVFVILGDSWWQLGTAVFLALVFGQIGFLGHDAGHLQVFSSRRANNILGVLCGNLAIGLNYGWWTGKHKRHHAHPNTEETDPDIMMGVLAFTGSQAEASRGIQRLAFRYQAYLVIPLFFLEALNLHAQSSSPWSSSSSRLERRWPSSPCSRASSGSTSRARSRLTIRGWLSCPRRIRPTSSAVRYSPHVTSAAAG